MKVPGSYANLGESYQKKVNKIEEVVMGVMQEIYQKLMYYLFCGLCIAYVVILGVGLVYGFMEMLCGDL